MSGHFEALVLNSFAEIILKLGGFSYTGELYTGQEMSSAPIGINITICGARGSFCDPQNITVKRCVYTANTGTLQLAYEILLIQCSRANVVCTTHRTVRVFSASGSGNATYEKIDRPFETIAIATSHRLRTTFGSSRYVNNTH